jgi:hypothetical protein
MTTPNDPTMSHDSLDAVIAAYMLAVEELLKMPTCFGKARRIVLDHLGNRYGRYFVNHWAFVRFATEQKLGLDFSTPPKRPPCPSRTTESGPGATASRSHDAAGLRFGTDGAPPR